MSDGFSVLAHCDWTSGTLEIAFPRLWESSWEVPDFLVINSLCLHGYLGPALRLLKASSPDSGPSWATSSTTAAAEPAVPFNSPRPPSSVTKST